MAEKNLVNETLIQIQNLEEVINENAKEILASTMKEEIGELVKESLKEGAKMETQEAEEEEFDAEDFETDEESEEESEEEFESEEDEMGDEDIMDMGDEDSEEDESEDEDMLDMDDEDMMDMDSEVEDLTGETDFDKVFKVFKNMKNSDTVTVIPDGDYTKISDEDEDVEYLIQAESEIDEMITQGKGEPQPDEMEEGEQEYEFEEEESDVVYEIEISDDENYEEELEEESDPDELYSEEWTEEEDNESYNMMEAKKAKKMETKEGMKPKVGKGAKLGSAKKFSYKKSTGGFKEDMKKANPLKGTGKPKFEFKEGEDMEMMPKGKMAKKGETKEASRTYGMGSKSGRGLRKGITPNRDLTFESVGVMEEMEMLRAKNEEYRKALNLFRDKLNEVALFNSNLAYATRLFTEHSTSKQEKINILRRFDTAETLKESKALYKTIKDELSQVTKVTPITESIERVIDREPQSGSAINLIESKTYENPQFLRMKDIMSKIAK
jgi:hypothetical protein